MKENFPNLAKEIDFQEVQKAQKLDPRRNTPRHIIIKLPKIIDNHSFIRFYLFTFRQMKGGRKRERNIGSHERQGPTSKITVSSKAVL